MLRKDHGLLAQGTTAQRRPTRRHHGVSVSFMDAASPQDAGDPRSRAKSYLVSRASQHTAALEREKQAEKEAQQKDSYARIQAITERLNASLGGLFREKSSPEENGARGMEGAGVDPGLDERDAGERDFEDPLFLPSTKDTIQTLLNTLCTDNRARIMLNLDEWFSERKQAIAEDLEALRFLELEQQPVEDLLGRFGRVERELERRELERFGVLNRFMSKLGVKKAAMKALCEERRAEERRRREESSSDAHGALSFAPAADSETERLRRLEQRRRDEQRAIRDALLEQKMEGEDGGEGATADEILGAITLQQTESKELEKRLENAVQRVAVLKQVLAAAQGVAAAAAPSGGGLGKGGGEQESQQLRGQDGGAAQSNVVLDFEGEQILAELRAKAKEARIAEAVSEKGGEDFEGASSAPTDPAEQRALAEKLGKECAELRELREKLEKEMKSTLAPRKTELMRPELIRVQSQLQDEEAEKIEERRLQQLLTSSQEALEALTAKKDEICGALNSGKKLAWSAEEDAREIKIRQAAALLEMGTEEERLHTDIRDVQDDLKTAHLAIDSENAAQEEFQKELDLKKDKHPSLVSGAREISSLEQEEAHLADLSEENLALQSKIDMLRHKVQQDQSARLAEGGGAGGVGGLLAAVKIQRRSLLGVGTVAKRKSGQVGVGAAAGTVGVFGASSPVASPSTGAAVSGATTNVSQETGDGGAAAPPPEQQDSPRDELTELLVKAGFAHRKHDIEQLLRLQQENKEMNAQIINLEGKIKLAKNASKSGEKIDEDFLRQIHELGAGGGGDGAEPPPELAWLKKDCKIQQRELNGLRNRWWNNRFDLAADLLGEGYQTSSEEEDAIAKTEVDAVEDGPRPPGRRGEKDWVNVEGESFRDASAKIEGLTGRRATLSVAAAGGTGGGPLGDQSPVESAISKLRQGAGSVPTLGIFAKRVVAAPPPARKKSLSSTVLDSRAAHIRAASEVRVEGLSVLVNGAAENNEFIKPARSVMRGGLLVERQREQAALLSGLRIGGAVSHGRGAEQSTPPPKSSTKKVLLMQSSTASPRSDQIAHGAGAGSRSPVGKGSPSSSITRNLQPGQVGEDEVPTHKGKATVEVDHNPNVQNQKSGQTLVSMLNRRRMMLRQMDGTASEGGIRLEVSTTPRSPRPPEVKR